MCVCMHDYTAQSILKLAHALPQLGLYDCTTIPYYRIFLSMFYRIIELPGIVSTSSIRQTTLELLRI